MSEKTMEIKTFRPPADKGAGRMLRRRAVLWPAQIIINGHSFTCQIRNLSLGGAKVKLAVPLKEGTIVTLDIPARDISFRSEVVWQAGDLIGLIFQETPSYIRKCFGTQADILGLADVVIEQP